MLRDLLSSCVATCPSSLLLQALRLAHRQASRGLDLVLSVLVCLCVLPSPFCVSGGAMETQCAADPKGHMSMHSRHSRTQLWIWMPRSDTTKREKGGQGKEKSSGAENADDGWSISPGMKKAGPHVLLCPANSFVGPICLYLGPTVRCPLCG